MAVHNEHSLRSFPSFCENDNFEDDYDDDDGDNNFVISLEDSGDDDDQKSTNVSATAYPATRTPYNSCLTPPHSVVSSSHSKNISISYSTFPSSADNIGISAYQQFVVPAPKNNYETEQCPSVYSTSSVNQWDCQQRSSTYGGLPVPSFLESGGSHQDGMRSTISLSNGCSGSTFPATEEMQPHKSPSDIGVRQFYHSQSFSQQHQNFSQHQSFSKQQHQSFSQQQPVSQQHQSFSQQQVSHQNQSFSQQQVSHQNQSFSQQQQILQQHQNVSQHQQQVSEQHQSFSQQQHPVSRQQQQVSHHQITQTTASSDVPNMCLETIHLDRKAGGMWSEAVFLPPVGISDGGFSGIATGTIEAASCEGTSTVHDRYQITSTSPSTPSHNLPKISCLSSSYIHTLKIRPVDTGHSVCEIGKSQKKPPFNEKAACNCIMCYKQDGTSKQCQGNYSGDPVLTDEEMLLIINEPTKRKRQYRITGNSKRKKALMQSSSDLGLQPQPACDVFTAGSTKQVGECETTASSVTSPVVSSPAMPRLVSAPVYRSNSTKVFLQPSEILSQRSQSVLPELTPMNKVTAPSNVNVASPIAACKETQQACVSSSVTPPSYKIIYVRPDQVLVCPNKTSPSIKVVPLCKPPQANTHQKAVFKFPQTSTHNKMLSTDSRQQVHMPTVVTHPSPKQCMNNSSTITQQSLISKARNDLRNVLKNAEKIDISTPGKVLIKLQQSSSTSDLQHGGVQTSQTIINDASTPASKSSVYTTSLLKDFKLSPVKTTGAIASAQTSQPGHTTTTASSPGVSKPTSREITQALMCLIKSHFQGQTSSGSKSLLMNLIKGSLQTSESNNLPHRTVPPVCTSQQNVTVIGSNISNNCHTIATVQPVDKQKLKSSEKDIPESDVVCINLDRVSSPSLPQEGLPSSYIEDWVNQTKTYVPEQLNTSDCLSELHLTSATALEQSPCDTLHEHDDIKYNINADIKSSMLEEAPGPRDIHVHSKLKPLPSKPTVALHHNLQAAPSSPSSEPSAEHIPNICHNDIQMQVDQPPVSCLSTPEQNLQSFSMKRHSQAMSDSEKSSHCKSSTQKGPIRSTFCTGLLPNGHRQVVQTAATSMVMDSSKGIKLKIKLGEPRQENISFNHSYNTLESSFSSSEGVAEPHSTDELCLQKKPNGSRQEVRIDETEEDVNSGANGDKAETAEEMFQRFQKQAEQEVLKAQMGMGYLSRSLRPSRANVALTENSPFVFGTGLPRKKITCEDKHVSKHLTGEDKNSHDISKHITCEDKRVPGGSKHTGDNSSCCSLSEVDQQSSKYNTQNTKPSIRNKRQADELNSRGVKLKQAKMSIKDYPRLKQDGSITNRKKLYCANILAGHQVYVKFNTYENVVSGRVFLVPFFNIGGTRTQFDVEDFDYINKAVLEFEKDERSCARHLLFYAREGQKASFLRKETYFQASHIDDKNYRKSSFILEGFQRDNRKQTEPSSGQWKVDHAIDIEIDRAEVDNDAEVEFDVGMTYGQLIHGLETHAEGVTQTRREQIFHRSGPERFHVENVRDVCENDSNCIANQGTQPTHAEVMVYNESNNCKPAGCSQSSGVKAFTQLRRMNMEDSGSSHVAVSVSLVPAVSNSLITSGKIIPPTKALESQCKYSDGDRLTTREQLAEAITSTILQNGSHERDITCSDGRSSCCAEVKLEEPDDGYNNSTNFVPNICSTSISTNIARNPCDLLIDKFNITVKSEPVDEYSDSQARNTPCSSVSGRLEHSGTVASPLPRIISCSHIQDSAIIHPTSTCENCDGANDSTSLSMADAAAGHTASNPPSTHVGASHGLVAAPCIVTPHLSPSRPHAADSTPTAKVEMSNPQVCQLEQSETDVRTDLNLDLVCDSVLASEISSPELSSPKSHLPLSSPSVSSEVSFCSDIDDSLVTTETGSLTAMSAPELTTQDANKQGSVPNKITSLVESLRNRLTQDTSILPPWLASPKTEVMKKKRQKTNAKNPSVKLSSSSQSTLCESLPVIPSVLSSTLDTSASATPAQHASMLTSHPTDLDSLTTTCSPSLPQDVLEPVAALLSSPVSSHNNILNKNPMLLPVLQPTELHKSPLMRFPTAASQLPHMSNDQPSVAGRTSHKLVQKLGITEAETLPVTKEVSVDEKCTAIGGVDKASSSALKSKPADDGQDPSHCWEATLSGIEHSELLDSFRQSPIDLEIEVGEEDLPETALNLQPILPNEVALHQQSEEEVGECFSHLPGSNQSRTGRATSRFAERTKQTKEHLGEESGRLEKGSVASYLSQKFLFSGAAHRIKGPRLLQMRTNSKTSCGEQNTSRPSKVSIVPEPITVAELSQTPSVVEIFGACLRKKSTENPDIQGDSPDTGVSHNRLKGDGTEQNLPPVAVCPAKIANTKTTAKKKTGRMSGDASSRAVPIKPKPALATKTRKSASTQLPLSHEAVRSDHTRDLLSQMPVCKVVLKRLLVNKLSENVFIIKTDSVGQNHLPQTTEPEKHSKSDSQACSSSKSTLRKVLKKKKKKSTKETRRLVVKPKRDIVDYYASMLENLQKKAQLLEEESRRIAQEDSKISVTASRETTPQNKPSGEENLDEDNLKEMEEKLEKSCEEAKEKIEKTSDEVKEYIEKNSDGVKEYIEKNSDGVKEYIEKNSDGVKEYIEKNSDGVKEYIEKTSDEVKEERQTSFEEVKGMEANIEIAKMKSNVKTLSSMQAEVDLPASCSGLSDLCPVSTASQFMVSHDCTTHKDCRLVLESNRVGRAPGPTDPTQTDSEDFGLQSEVSDSNWEFLQKFCNETILDQSNTSCLEKVPEEICFPKVAAAGVDELKFGKKDIVLGCSMGDETEVLATSEVLDGTEDTDCGLEEQERNNLDDDDEVLLIIDIPKSCAFDHEDKEESFSQGFPSKVKQTLSSIGNKSITDVECVNIMSGKLVTSATPAAKQALLSSEPASTHAESRDPIVTKGPVNDSGILVTKGAVNDSDLLVTKGAVNDSDLIVTKGAVNRTEPSDPTISRSHMNGHHQPFKQRNVQVSPSWERLLGQSAHIIQKSVQKNSISCPEEPTNQNVSFVASSNFKGKFKLPKGILSKAIMMSRDMRNAFEKPSKEDMPASNQEIDSSLNNLKVSVSKVLEKVVSPNESQRKLLQSESSAGPVAQAYNLDTAVKSPVEPRPGPEASPVEPRLGPEASPVEPGPEASPVEPRPGPEASPVEPRPGAEASPVEPRLGLEASPVESRLGPEASLVEPRLGPVALTLIQAKPEMPPKKKRGRKLKRRLKGRNQPQHVPAQSGDDTLQEADILLKTRHVDMSLKLDHDSLADPRQELQSRTGLFPDLENCGLGVKGDCMLAPNKPCSADSATCKHQSEEPVIQTKDNHLSQLVLPANHSSQPASTNTSLNELHTECVKQNRKDGIFSNIDFLCDLTDEPAAKLTTELPSNKQEKVEKILRNGVIDIRKLKMKLNPLITSKLKEKTGPSDVGVLPSQQGSVSELVKEAMPQSWHTSVQDDCLSLQYQTCKVSSPKCTSPGPINILQPHDKLETNSSEHHPISASTESPNHIPLSTNKQIPNVNATKLCNFLKNFHKITSKAHNTDARDILPESNICGSGDGFVSSSLSLHSQEKPDRLNPPASTSKIKGRKRGRKGKVAGVSQANKLNVRMAKEKASKIVIDSPAAKVLDDEHGESVGDMGRNEDKGKRSFFDCLSSVPLHVWEDKQEKS